MLPGYSTISLQPLVKQWVEHVKFKVAQIEMTTPHMISVSMAIEYLLMIEKSIPDEQKVVIIRESEFRTKRKWGRPKGKSTADWDSGLKKLPKVDPKS